MKAVILGCAAVTLILGGVAAIAWSILAGHRLSCLPRVIACRAARAVLLARWAWACRKPPARAEGEELDYDEKLALVAADRAWRQPAAPERERTRT